MNYIDQIFVSYEQWKILKAYYDLNDLQVDCDHRAWEAATDSCAICGKDWNTILWAPSGGSKPCCGGGIGKTAVYGTGKWHDVDCDTLKTPAITQSPKAEQIDYRPKPAYGCQCGAGATSNPNCHSHWCPEYKK